MREQHCLRNAQRRAKLSGHASSLAEFNTQCEVGSRVLCAGLATSQDLSSCRVGVLRFVQTVVHRDFRQVAPSGEPI